MLEAGSPSRTRTSDPMINSHLLYQLSYWGTQIVFLTIKTKLIFKDLQDYFILNFMNCFPQVRTCNVCLYEI